MKPSLARLSPILALLLASLVLAGCGSSGSAEGGSASTGGATAASEEWKQAPVIPKFDRASAKALRQEVAAADEAGMRPGLFAKIGDSNTAFARNLYGLGCYPVDPGSDPAIRETLDRYLETPLDGLKSYPRCEKNTFSRISAGAVPGVWAEWLLTPVGELRAGNGLPVSDECRNDQTPLVCEVDLIRPRWSIIMVGTNDARTDLPLGNVLKRHLLDIVAETRETGSVAVLSTVPPMTMPTLDGRDGTPLGEEVNALIWEVAQEEQVPLINLWRALTGPGMINQGLSNDGLHLGVPGGVRNPRVVSQSALLTPEALRYGSNKRHLVWLQTLDRLDSVAGTG